MTDQVASNQAYRAFEAALGALARETHGPELERWIRNALRRTRIERLSFHRAYPDSKDEWQSRPNAIYDE